MALEDFFAQHPVFRHDELYAYLNRERNYNDATLKASLSYHVKKGHIARIRRGYYAVNSNKGHFNAYASLLIAGRVSENSRIAYHSALTFHGIAYSSLNTYFFINTVPIKTFNFEQVTYQRVLPPKVLIQKDILIETKKYDRLGLNIHVTTIERTLVDCLDKPQYSGGFEEIWRTANMVNFIDAERMVNYALILNNATTIAKLGFFLEQHQAHFGIEEKVLSRLEKEKPKGVHYLTTGSRDNHYVRRWNLMVPLAIQNKTWEEQDHDI